MKKFIILSCLIISLQFLGYFMDKNFILDSNDFLVAIILMTGTFIVIKKINKFGLVLWILGFAGPRMYYPIFSLLYLSEDTNIWNLVINLVCQLAICMCFCRLAAQWTNSTWFSPDHLTEKAKKNLHFFWKSYIYLEECLFFVISVGLIQAITLSIENAKLMENPLFKIIPCWGVHTIYKHVKLNSLRILSPIASKIENEQTMLDIDKALKEEGELKDSLVKILSIRNLESLERTYYQVLQEFPNEESIISKTYKKQIALVFNS